MRPPDQRLNFSSWSTTGIFLGYETGVKGYLVLKIQTMKITVTRDEVFYENEFPGQSLPSNFLPNNLHPDSDDPLQWGEQDTTVDNSRENQKSSEILAPTQLSNMTETPTGIVIP